MMEGGDTGKVEAREAIIGQVQRPQQIEGAVTSVGTVGGLGQARISVCSTTENTLTKYPFTYLCII